MIEDTMETVMVEVGVVEVTKVTINLRLSDSLGMKANDAWPNTGR